MICKWCDQPIQIRGGNYMLITPFDNLSAARSEEEKEKVNWLHQHSDWLYCPGPGDFHDPRVGS